MSRSIAIAILPLCSIACEELAVPRDVMGNFEVQYVDNLRIYINDELVAEVASGEDADIEWDGETFQASQVCGDEGVQCPSETYWRTVGIDQPWGNGRKLLNFVNLDQDRGTPGQRMGGALENNGSFAMLSGLGIDTMGACQSLGVGTVRGQFNLANDTINSGVIAYGWAAGCRIGDVDVGGELRLETDYTATRSGDYDVSTVEPEAPIDTSGEEAGEAPLAP